MNPIIENMYHMELYLFITSLFAMFVMGVWFGWHYKRIQDDYKYRQYISPDSIQNCYHQIVQLSKQASELRKLYHAFTATEREENKEIPAKLLRIVNEQKAWEEKLFILTKKV